MSSGSELTPDTEMLLFCADRTEHQGKIASLLAAGVSVVCDRFMSSTWAYQVFGRGCRRDILENVSALTVSRLPDLTILLDLNPADALQRAKERLARDGRLASEGRFEAESAGFFSRVREGFLWYAQQEKFGTTAVIEASGAMEDVHMKIRNVCCEVLGL